MIIIIIVWLSPFNLSLKWFANVKISLLLAKQRKTVQFHKKETQSYQLLFSFQNQQNISNSVKPWSVFPFTVYLETVWTVLGPGPWRPPGGGLIAFLLNYSLSRYLLKTIKTSVTIIGWTSFSFAFKLQAKAIKDITPHFEILLIKYKYKQKLWEQAHKIRSWLVESDSAELCYSPQTLEFTAGTRISRL